MVICLRSAWFQIIETWAQKNVRLLCWIVVFVTFGPIVTDRICKYLSVRIETALGDRLLHGFRWLQFGASIFVPETECAVRSNRCQCAVHRMECDVINRINVLNVGIWVHAMALECEIIFWIYGIHLKSEEVKKNTTHEYRCWTSFVLCILPLTYCIATRPSMLPNA